MLIVIELGISVVSIRLRGHRDLCEIALQGEGTLPGVFNGMDILLVDWQLPNAIEHVLLDGIKLVLEELEELVQSVKCDLGVHGRSILINLFEKSFSIVLLGHALEHYVQVERYSRVLSEALPCDTLTVIPVEICRQRLVVCPSKLSD